ncbi:MAG: hypothetical protein R3B90_22350 [Planctomycetaceae bacterium]
MDAELREEVIGSAYFIGRFQGFLGAKCVFVGLWTLATGIWHLVDRDRRTEMLLRLWDSKHGGQADQLA